MFLTFFVHIFRQWIALAPLGAKGPGFDSTSGSFCVLSFHVLHSFLKQFRHLGLGEMVTSVGVMVKRGLVHGRTRLHPSTDSLFVGWLVCAMD